MGKTLAFKIQDRMRIGALQPINDNALKEYKDLLNRYYDPFIDRINGCGGYIEIIVYPSGADFSHTGVSATAEVLDEINDHYSK